MKHNRLRRWELALALSICITLCHGFAFGAPGAGWWGVIFPGLAGTGAAHVETANFPDNGIQLRFQLLDWLHSLTA